LKARLFSNQEFQASILFGGLFDCKNQQAAMIEETGVIKSFGVYIDRGQDVQSLQ
jgi:hypothetical protein